jgi:ankyrin repeat protein
MCKKETLTKDKGKANYATMSLLPSQCNLLVSKCVPLNCTTGKGRTALHMAVRFNQINIVPYLLQEGSQVHFRTNNSELFKPLNGATFLGNLDMVGLLIHYGANVNARDQNTGFTALHSAAMGNNV